LNNSREGVSGALPTHNLR